MEVATKRHLAHGVGWLQDAYGAWQCKGQRVQCWQATLQHTGSDSVLGGHEQLFKAHCVPVRMVRTTEAGQPGITDLYELRHKLLR